jgi:hypothetical protein
MVGTVSPTQVASSALTWGITTLHFAGAITTDLGAAASQNNFAFSPVVTVVVAVDVAVEVSDVVGVVLGEVTVQSSKRPARKASTASLIASAASSQRLLFV